MYQLELLGAVSAAEKAFYFLALNEMYPWLDDSERRSSAGNFCSRSSPCEKQVHRRPDRVAAIFGTPIFFYP